MASALRCRCSRSNMSRFVLSVSKSRITAAF
jgi:hypothetical protein